MSLHRKILTTTLIAAAIVLSTAVIGCNQDVNHRPTTLVSPYPADKLWAVAPLENESGVSLADGLVMADRIAQQLQQVPGIRVMSVNRVIEALEASRLGRITSIHEAEQLMRTLGADGLLVGTITAWDPYDPPKIGLAVDLYRRQAASPGPVDTRRLTRAATSDELPGLIIHESPIAQSAGYFDAANGDVRQNLTAYAYGRAPSDSPAGWRRYLLSIDLYGEFVAHEVVRDIFSTERRRLTNEAIAEQSARQQTASGTTPTDGEPALPELGSRLNR